MNFLFGKILFLPVMTKKNGQIKEQCSPTRSKTVFFQAVATLTQVAPDDQSRNEQKKWSRPSFDQKKMGLWLSR